MPDTADHRPIRACRGIATCTSAARGIEKRAHRGDEPATGESLGTTADATADDVDRAVAAAREAFRMWRDDARAGARGGDCAAHRAILRENADELAWLEAVDTGNPFQAMRFDVEISAGYMDYFAGLVTEIKGDTIPIGAGTLNYTLREPLGVVVPHRRVQSSVAVHRRQMRRAAGRRQHARS